MMEMEFGRKAVPLLYKKLLVIIVLLFSLLFVSTASIAKDKVIIITGDSVNVREEPSISSSVITQIDSGETFPFLQEENDWYQIELENGTKGWIASWLGKIEEIESTISSTKNGIILVDNLNIRSEPNTNSTIINQLQKDDHVQVISQENDWTEILYQSKSAWISSQYVDILEEEKNSEEDNTQTNMDAEFITTLFDNTSIKEKPTSKSKSIGETKADTVLEVLEKKDDWYKVKFDHDKTGYIATWIVSDRAVPATNPTTIEEAVNKTIVIDAGHGGRDDGAAGSNGTHEKELTLNVATQLASNLKRIGFNVVMTRSDDQFIPLEDRTYIATNNNADAFISIHFDSIEDSSVTGHTTYYYHDRDTQLSELIHQEISHVAQIRDRGVRFGDYFVLRENLKPSVLLELGYISNPEEEKIINSKNYQQQIAEAIAKGIQKYFSQI